MPVPKGPLVGAPAGPTLLTGTSRVPLPPAVQRRAARVAAGGAGQREVPLPVLTQRRRSGDRAVHLQLRTPAAGVDRDVLGGCRAGARALAQFDRIRAAENGAAQIGDGPGVRDRQGAGQGDGGLQAGSVEIQGPAAETRRGC